MPSGKRRRFYPDQRSAKPGKKRNRDASHRWQTHLKAQRMGTLYSQLPRGLFLFLVRLEPDVPYTSAINLWHMQPDSSSHFQNACCSRRITSDAYRSVILASCPWLIWQFKDSVIKTIAVATLSVFCLFLIQCVPSTTYTTFLPSFTNFLLELIVF